jgi:hypothetical protein
MNDLLPGVARPTLFEGAFNTLAAALPEDVEAGSCLCFPPLACCNESADLRTAEAVRRSLMQMRRDSAHCDRTNDEQLVVLLRRVNDWSTHILTKAFLPEKLRRRAHEMRWHVVALVEHLHLPMNQQALSVDERAKVHALFEKHLKKTKLDSGGRAFTEREFRRFTAFVNEMAEDFPQRKAMRALHDRCLANPRFFNPNPTAEEVAVSTGPLCERSPEFARLLLSDENLRKSYFKWRREGLNEEAFIQSPELAQWLISSNEANRLNTHGFNVERQVADGDFYLPMSVNGVDNRVYSRPWQEVINQSGDLVLGERDIVPRENIGHRVPQHNRATCLGSGFQSWNILDWPGVDLSKAYWWRDLPLFMEKEVTLKDESDTGHRFGLKATLGSDEVHLANTHMICRVMEPVAPPKDGKVRVRIYSFGLSYDQSVPVNPLLAFAPRAPKIQYPDQNENLHHLGEESLEFPILSHQFEEAMELVKGMKLEERAPFDPTDRTKLNYNFYNSSCVTLPERVIRLLGLDSDVPTRISVLDAVNCDWLRRGLKTIWQGLKAFCAFCVNLILYVFGGYKGLFTSFSDVWKRSVEETQYIQHPWGTIQYMRAQHMLSAAASPSVVVPIRV